MISFKKMTKLFSGLLLLGLLAGFGCSTLTGGDDEDDGDGETVTYDLSVTASPTEGGSVDPSSGSFDEGEEVEVSATAAEGWTFSGWSGDINSSENPLTFSISQDTDLTASFEEGAEAEAFANQIQVSDGTYSEKLTLGMETGASAGFDAGLDDEAPPAPPEGSFYAHFVIQGYNLFKDYRPVQSQQTIWELNFSPTSSNTISLSWDFSSSTHQGSLTLVDDFDNPSVQVNMSTESSYDVTDTSVNTLYIIHE